MAFPQATRPRVFAALWLATSVALLGLALKNSFDGASYDSLHSLAGVQAEATADSPVVIVYLDLGSFTHAQLDPAQPWPRERHAELLNRLQTAGAKAAVFDIVFGNAGPSAEADKKFADAIRENGRVVLAAEFNATTVEDSDQKNWARVDRVEPIYPPFAQAAAAHGIASQEISDDYVVRRYIAGFTSEPQPSLTWATANFLQLPITQTTNALAAANQKWLRYYGPPLTIPHISYSQILETNGVTDDFFREKIVFIGARPLVNHFNERKDEFGNPFHSWKYKDYFMPGVEVHATEMLNLLRNDALQKTSAASENILLLIGALIFGGGLIWLRPLPATVVALVGAVVVPLISLAFFAHDIWFSWLVVSAVQIPAALFGSWLYQFQDWFFTRRKLEAARRSADAKIREQAALIDKAHDAILVQDLAGKIIYANPSAEKLYGWKFSELQPDSAVEIFSPALAVVEKARAAALHDGEWNGELLLQTRGGQTITVDSRWTLLRDDAGQASGLLLINSDITEKKTLEQQFLRTQRMNTIGTLAGGMAHDLNNALSPVLLGAQLLRRKSGDAEDRKMLTMIETSANRGADMVRQVLLFARGRGGEFERLELGPLVKELEKMVRETFPKNIFVETFLPRDLWSVRGNLTQLHQVLLNLCVNARDAMPDGGKLSFVADNVELSADEAKEIADGQPGKFISVSVSDTGTGMPPEVKAKIFEPFFTTKDEGKGTGIGLATVVRILKSHGGFLRVESEPGQGATFEIFIPSAEEISVSAAKPIEADLPRGHGELILIADDEQVICELVAAELQEFGYRVLAATNGADALTLFKQHADEVKLFITDASMPVMSGPQAIVAIRKLRPGLPVILSSGEACAEQLENVVELSKPFALAELLNTVSRCLK